MTEKLEINIPQEIKKIVIEQANKKNMPIDIYVSWILYKDYEAPYRQLEKELEEAEIRCEKARQNLEKAEAEVNKKRQEVQEVLEKLNII